MGHKQEPTAAKRGCLPKTLAGCGCLAVIAMVLLALLMGGLTIFAFSQLKNFAEPFVAEGYLESGGQLVDETERIAEPTVYTAQVVKIRDGADGSLAMLCQSAEIDGTVDGDIDFFGQQLVIKPDARVTGNVTTKGVQTLTVRGIIDGDIEMFGQVLVVEEGAIVHGDIFAKAAQTIAVKGTVLGDIEGNYQELQRSDAAKPRRIELDPPEEEEEESTDPSA